MTEVSSRDSGRGTALIEAGTVRRLRDALRAVLVLGDTVDDTARRSAERALADASEPVVNRMYESLLAYCDALVQARSAPARAMGVDGEDLALEAWQQALEYLARPAGDRIEDETHLARLLRCIARHTLSDRIDRAPSQTPLPFDEVRESWKGRAAPSPFAWEEHPGAEIVGLLFEREERFRSAFRQTNRRHPRQFRAFVLYELGAYLYSEADGTDAGRSHLRRLMRRYVRLIGVPEEDWLAVERTVVNDMPDSVAGDDLIPALRDVVNRVCGTTLRSRSTLSVLRYELNRLVSGNAAVGRNGQ